MENTNEIKALLESAVAQPIADANSKIDNLYKKVDAETATLQSQLLAVSSQVQQTNGRVTELERDAIRKDTEMRMMKGIAFLFFVPVIVSLCIWGLQNFISVAIK